MTHNQFFGRYKVYLVLSIVALSSWLVADLFEKEQIIERKAVDHGADFFSSGYYKKEMTPAGTVKSELTADRMTHYSDDGTTHLEKPVMVLHNDTTPPWVIKSESGIVEADKDHLLLAGQVFISREGRDKLRSFDIITSEVMVKLSINYANTSKQAKIIDGSNVTEGIGMDASFAEPVWINFFSNVKGLYGIN